VLWIDVDDMNDEMVDRLLLLGLPYEAFVDGRLLLAPLHRGQRAHLALRICAEPLPAGEELLVEQREEVRRATELSLLDPLYFVRRGAIKALEDLGDASAIPALRVTIDRDIEGAVRYESRVAIDSLRRGLSEEKALGQLRDEVEELRKSNRELRDRVDRIDPAVRHKGKK